VSRIVSRVVLIVATLLIVAFYGAPLGHYDFLETWGEGTYGAVLAPRSSVVTEVLAGSPAAKAGIRPGDRLIFASGWQQTRFRSPYRGDRQNVAVKSEGAPVRVVTLKAQPVAGFDLLARIGGIASILPVAVFIAVAFALVFVRPSVMTWSFFVFAVGYAGTQPLVDYWSQILSRPAFVAMSFVLGTICGSWSVMALLPFVLRFPRGDLGGWRKGVDKFVWIAMAVTFVLYVFEWRWIEVNARLPWWSLYLDQIVPLAAFALATVVLAKNYSVAQPVDRKRYGFLILGTIASFVAYAVYFVPGVPFAVGQVVGFAVVLMPICVAYAVFALRVIDVNFVLNRALVYSTISVGVVAFVSLLDFLTSQIISMGRFALPIELFATIAIGFLLDRINRGVERGVESIFFRGRRNAEAFLRRAAAALPYATKEQAISESLIEVPVEALRLSAAALYRRTIDADRFEGVATSANAPVAPPGFDGDQLLVRMMASSEKPVWLDEVRTHLDAANSAIYVLAVPITVRHELVTFTLYGAHANGAQLDSDEVDLLEDLAREAARAYDHVEAVRVRERYENARERAAAGLAPQYGD